MDLSLPVSPGGRIWPEDKSPILFFARPLYCLSKRIYELRHIPSVPSFADSVCLGWGTASIPFFRFRRIGVHGAIEIRKGLLGNLYWPVRRFEKDAIPGVLDLDNKLIGPVIAIDESKGFLEVLPVSLRGLDGEVAFAQSLNLPIDTGNAHPVHDRQRIETKACKHQA
jgi:hypothetical protein